MRPALYYDLRFDRYPLSQMDELGSEVQQSRGIINQLRIDLHESSEVL